MSYELEFLDVAFEEWYRIDGAVTARLRKKLERRLLEPRLPAQQLSGALVNCYKIRDDVSGCRLVYTVDDEASVVLVICVGRRSDGQVYRIAESRLE